MYKKIFKKFKVYLFNHLTLQINFFAMVDYSPTVDETGCGFGFGRMAGHGRPWAGMGTSYGHCQCSGEREQLGGAEAQDERLNISPPQAPRAPPLRPLRPSQPPPIPPSRSL